MAIQLRTSIPGPNSKALMAERQAHVARGPFHSTPVFASKAHGALIEDVDGNTLIDFASGIAVVNLGHTPGPVVQAIQDQSAKLIHSSFNVLPYEPYVRLAQKINSIIPGNYPKKTFLANSGAEAVENAVKAARFYTKRQAVIGFDHAFHGRTYMAMSLTSKAKPYKFGFSPLCAEVYHAPFPYSYRMGGGDPSQACLNELRELIEHRIGAENVAAVLVEPVLGEGGYIDAPAAFMRGLRELCTKHHIVLIADEIQTGFGRTGTMLACEHFGIEPDLVTLAKGLGSGTPISAVAGRAEIMDAPSEGGLGGTYGGNPIACMAALRVFEMLESGGGAVLKRARALGETLRARLEQWKADYPVIGDVRGLGPMRGIELVKNRDTKEPNKEAVQKLLRYCYEHGVILLSAGTFGNCIRLAMPLVIEDEILEEGLLVMENGFKSIGAES